jgi:16S rRNA (uracil1498-N3)-methyltransferase
LPVKIHLFQGLPKSDKMELIIQKAVELGVEEITPVEMNRCVVKIEEKKKKSKKERWQSIAESAAKQSKRVVIPKVNDIISYKQFLEKSEELSVLLVPYENKEGMKATKEALKEIKSGDTVGIIIGPEGGFDEKEIDLVTGKNGKTISLGSRILRTETAAIASVTMCMLYAEMELGEINE